MVDVSKIDSNPGRQVNFTPLCLPIVGQFYKLKVVSSIYLMYR